MIDNAALRSRIATRRATSRQRPRGLYWLASGVAWDAYGCGNGTLFGSLWYPHNADCRGGVFAVFAKIPPPIASIRAYIGVYHVGELWGAGFTSLLRVQKKVRTVSHADSYLAMLACA